MTKVSKYDVLNLLAKKMAFYRATQWLKLPHPELGGQSPSDLLKKDKIEEVYATLKSDLGIVD